MKEISTHEASIIMLMTSTLLEYSYDMLREFSMIQERTTKRAVSLATLYQTAYINVRWCAIDVCGLNIKFKTASYIFDCSFFFRFSFFSHFFLLFSNGEMPFARLFSSATSHLRDILLSDILFARHFNCAISHLRDIPVARHPICATFQLRDIPYARQPICATFFPHV